MLDAWRKALALGQAAGDSVYPVRSNLVDVELAAGEIDAAIASGTALVELLRNGRATGSTRAALGDGAFEGLLADGERLADCQVPGLAFDAAMAADEDAMRP